VTKDITLIVGLGNPGQQYLFTRHNIGFWVMDYLAEDLGLSWQEKSRFGSLWAEGQYKGKKLYLVKPKTYMNRSGLAVSKIMSWYKMTPNQVLIVYDDMDLPFGQIRIRKKGGDGGHRGLRSILEEVNTGDIARVRLGVGAPPPYMDPADFVLQSLSHDELLGVREMCLVAKDAVFCALTDGLETAMNQYNKTINGE